MRTEAEIENVRGGTHAEVAPGDAFASELRGFGVTGLVALAVILSGNALFAPVSALLVLVWRWRSGTPWRDLGFAAPMNWTLTIGGGLLVGITLKLAAKILVLPLLGAEPVNHAYHYLAGNRAAIPGALYSLLIGAAWGEETLFRGFLFERFGKWVRSRWLTLCLTSLLFGWAHYPEQGLAGAEQGTLAGLVYGGLYLATGRIWMSIVAHAAFNLTAYAIIYWDLEVWVSQLVFGT